MQILIDDLIHAAWIWLSKERPSKAGRVICPWVKCINCFTSGLFILRKFIPEADSLPLLVGYEAAGILYFSLFYHLNRTEKVYAVKFI